MRTNELILYKNMEYEELLLDMTFLMEHYDNEYYNQEDLKGLLFSCMNELLELSECHGFFGNLWHTFLTFLLANDENAYSTSCEITGETKGSLNLAAEHDFWIFKELFDYDFTALMRVLDAGCFSLLLDYENTQDDRIVFNKRIRDRICNLSRELEQAEDVHV